MIVVGDKHDRDGNGSEPDEDPNRADTRDIVLRRSRRGLALSGLRSERSCNE